MILNIPERKTNFAIVAALTLYSLTFYQTPVFAEVSKPATLVQDKEKNKKVLDPHQFFGQAKAGYVAAQRIPTICAKLFCYCGCDLTDCHGTLLDCFTSDHGVDCHVCQEEALVALRMHGKGKDLEKIQKYVDKKYEKEYPFELESDALKKYKANRLWDKKSKSNPTSKTAPTKIRNKATKNKKPCCGGSSKQKSP